MENKQKIKILFAFLFGLFTLLIIKLTKKEQVTEIIEEKNDKFEELKSNFENQLRENKKELIKIKKELLNKDKKEEVV